MLTFFLVIIALANIALPLTNAFVGEFLIFNGILTSYTKYYVWFTVMAGICIILGAVYILGMIRKVAYGNVNDLSSGVVDIKWNEKLALGIIVVMIIGIGIYPQPMLNLTSDLTNSLINKFEALRHVVPVVPK